MTIKKLFLTVLLITCAVSATPQTLIQHPWQGKKVAYFGDSITDPRNSGSKKKYWGFLEDWLQITPTSMASADGNGMISPVRRNS